MLREHCTFEALDALFEVLGFFYLHADNRVNVFDEFDFESRKVILGSYVFETSIHVQFKILEVLLGCKVLKILLCCHVLDIE